MDALLGIGTAFGLSGSAGLNAYIPLLTAAVLTRLQWIELQAPYNVLGNEWVIGALIVLLLIEMTVDKIPAVDTVNDFIQTLIRPAAGALLFVANADVIADVSPVIAVIAGIILAGGVHAAKGAVRPAVTLSTGGTGNWFISLVEDVIALIVSVLSLLLPVLALVVIVLLGIAVFRWYRRRKRTPKLYRQT